MFSLNKGRQVVFPILHRKATSAVLGFLSGAMDGRACWRHWKGAPAIWRLGVRWVHTWLCWLVWQHLLSLCSSFPHLLFKLGCFTRNDLKRTVNQLRVWKALPLSAAAQGERWHVSDGSVWYQRHNHCLEPLEETQPVS